MDPLSISSNRTSASPFAPPAVIPSASAMSEFVHQLKLLTIGDSGVGKTWLLMRWAGAADLIDKRSRSLPTIGVDFKMKTVSIDGRRVKIQVWDTAGQERFRTITNSYFRHSHGILLVFDVTDPRSFANIRSWIGQIELHDKEGLPTILVGNKCDLEDQRAVARDQAEAVAKEFGITYFETSAVENINVEDAFACIIEDVYVGMQERGQCLSEGRVLRGNNAQFAQVQARRLGNQKGVDGGAGGEQKSRCTC